MNLTQILLLIGAAVVVFWVAPCVVATLRLFCGRHRPETVMNKYYYIPYRAEMDRCISFFEALGGQRVGIRAEDGTPLSAVWYDHGGGKTVLMAHGFKASAMSNFCISAKAFWDRGYNLLLIDQRAHGESGGNVCGFGLREQYDLIGWIGWIESHTQTAALAVYGVSMGCAAMAYASDRLGPDRVRAMILDCGFFSPMEQLATVGKRLHVPWKIMLPSIRALARMTMGLDLDKPVTDALSRTRIPAFFLHGAEDVTVDPEDGRRNWAACASEKEFVLVPGAEHTMAFVVGGEALQQKLFAFLEQHMNAAN